MKTYVGVELEFNAFLISALNGGRFTPDKELPVPTRLIISIIRTSVIK